MTKSFAQKIAEARAKYRLSQRTVGKIIGRSQFWVSFAERAKFPISEHTANKILLAIHRTGQRVRAMTIPASELQDFRLGPRSNAKSFKNLKTLTKT